MFSCENCKNFKNTYFEKHLSTAASVDCKKFWCYRKPNWNEVWIKIKIYCLFWADFTTCPNVFIVDFEQVFAAGKLRVGKKGSEINKNFFRYFLWKLCLLFLLHLLVENFKPERYCFERSNSIWCLNGYDFELYQTMFQNKTTLFVVYKWPLRIETTVIKLNEIKLKCLKFCSLNSVAFCARKK